MIEDPVFAAIAEHKYASEAFGACRATEIEFDALDAAEAETAFMLARTVPATFFGAVAYLDYILTTLRARGDDAIHATAFRTLEMSEWRSGMRPLLLAEASPFDLPSDFYVDA